TMVLAGRCYNEKNKPVILDPVGEGASGYRKALAAELMKNIKLQAIKGNISEIRRLITGGQGSRSVDADQEEAVKEENMKSYIEMAQYVAKETIAVIVITGAIDIAADSSRAFAVRGGQETMSRITGCGCMLGSLLAAFEGANPEKSLEAAAAAAAAMSL